ncbi:MULTISPECIES: hypothetical protein [Chryseobacterium]|uniref:Uncharacterized protein n=1 Tax=Chryseobacterium koreense CCUG 49689 TaxID=1304281 RepID=A0A0J7IY47_9FLAO|nr:MULTISPECIES: hypothetical protein [Chryseobacterium]KMQ70922.1 hypothetical protein ACM44_09910 [Chryseobacterium koreense CCUG 49689]MBB5332416.1 hypothetical protein [Chryseobacterium koreense]
MKKWISYFFICAYLLSFPEARQILKFPTLVEHFISHKLRDHQTTFASFLKMHYLEDHGIDADYSQDMKLPFKVQDSSHYSLNIIVPPSNSETLAERSHLIDGVKHNFVYAESFFPSIFLKIWQPPKI